MEGDDKCVERPKTTESQENNSQGFEGNKFINDQSANIFITEKGGIKIGDLNVSKVVQQGLCFTQTGTPYYASPEIWKDQPYGSKSDIWSLGCVIYELVCLRPPFAGDVMEELYKSVTKGLYSRIPNMYSTELNDILRMMLQVDQMIRPSA